MQKIITEEDLRTAILQLEMRQLEEGKLLKEQFLVAYESVKPINLIKNTFIEAANSPDLQSSMLSSGVGVLAGYLGKVLFMGATGGPVRRILGNVIMFGIKNLISNNPDIVNAAGSSLLSKVKNLWPEKEAIENEKINTLKT